MSSCYFDGLQFFVSKNLSLVLEYERMTDARLGFGVIVNLKSEEGEIISNSANERLRPRKQTANSKQQTTANNKKSHKEMSIE